MWIGHIERTDIGRKQGTASEKTERFRALLSAPGKYK